MQKNKNSYKPTPMRVLMSDPAIKRAVKGERGEYGYFGSVGERPIACGRVEGIGSFSVRARIDKEAIDRLAALRDTLPSSRKHA